MKFRFNFFNDILKGIENVMNDSAYRNQSSSLQSKSFDWFLSFYDVLRHSKVTEKKNWT